MVLRFSGFYWIILNFTHFLCFIGFLSFTGLAGILSITFPVLSPQIRDMFEKRKEIDLLAPPQVKIL